MGKHKPGVDRKVAYRLARALHGQLRAIFSNISSPKYARQYEIDYLFKSGKAWKVLQQVHTVVPAEINPKVGYLLKASRRDKPPATWALLIEMDGNAYTCRESSKAHDVIVHNLMEPGSIEAIVEDYEAWVKEHVRRTHTRTKPKLK